MSGGEQQMLAMGRAADGWPTVLLMDEPSRAWRRCAGLEHYEAVEEINKQGTRILLWPNANSRGGSRTGPYVREVGGDHAERDDYDRLQREPTRSRGYAGRMIAVLAASGSRPSTSRYAVLSAVAASWLSTRQGLRRERPGLSTGMPMSASRRPHLAQPGRRNPSHRGRSRGALRSAAASVKPVAEARAEHDGEPPRSA